jgi:hypothetical protein
MLTVWLMKVQSFFWQSSLLDDGTIFRRLAIEGASVEAKVLQHLKGRKVIIFKERRKGYKETVIDNILLKL